MEKEGVVALAVYVSIVLAMYAGAKALGVATYYTAMIAVTGVISGLLGLFRCWLDDGYPFYVHFLVAILVSSVPMGFFITGIIMKYREASTAFLDQLAAGLAYAAEVAASKPSLAAVTATSALAAAAAFKFGKYGASVVALFIAFIAAFALLW